MIELLNRIHIPYHSPKFSFVNLIETTAKESRRDETTLNVFVTDCESLHANKCLLHSNRFKEKQKTSGNYDVTYFPKA